MRPSSPLGGEVCSILAGGGGDRMAGLHMSRILGKARGTADLVVPPMVVNRRFATASGL